MIARIIDDDFLHLGAREVPSAAALAALPRRLSRVQIELGSARTPSPPVVKAVHRLLAARPGLELRLLLGEKLDLSFLAQLPSLTHLSISSCTEVTCWDALGEAKLEHLEVELPRRAPRDLLAPLPPTLISLSLVPETRGSAPPIDLSPLTAHRRLRALHLEAPASLDVLPALRSVRRLFLRHTKMADLAALAALKLEALGIVAGPLTDLGPLTRQKLTLLVLAQLAKLKDLGPIAKIPSLRGLNLSRLSQVTALPSLRGLGQLRFVRLETLDRLRDLRPLATAPKLEEIVLPNTPRTPEELAVILKGRSLKRVGLGLARARDQHAMTALLSARPDVIAEVFRYPELRGRYGFLEG